MEGERGDGHHFKHLRKTLSMDIRKYAEQKPFTTKDGSTVRSLLDFSNAAVQKKSLTAATLQFGGETYRHYHHVSQSLY